MTTFSIPKPTLARRQDFHHAASRATALIGAIVALGSACGGSRPFEKPTLVFVTNGWSESVHLSDCAHLSAHRPEVPPGAKTCPDGLVNVISNDDGTRSVAFTGDPRRFSRPEELAPIDSKEKALAAVWLAAGPHRLADDRTVYVRTQGASVLVRGAAFIVQANAADLETPTTNAQCGEVIVEFRLQAEVSRDGMVRVTGVEDASHPAECRPIDPR